MLDKLEGVPMKYVFGKCVCVLAFALISSLLFAGGIAISFEDSIVLSFSNASNSTFYVRP